MAEFHSFSGVDIHAVFGDTVFGELQMIRYNIDREKAPVYTMGSANLRTIARGKRLISGACVFVVFEKDSLVSTLNERGTEFNPYLTKSDTANLAGGSADSLAGSSQFGIAGESAGQSASRFTQSAQAKLADQLLPFDVTLVGANEYGQYTKMTIKGLELMTESGGISIDDLVIEKQMNFIAREIENWNNGSASTPST